jgi:hypothetical protein
VSTRPRAALFSRVGALARVHQQRRCDRHGTDAHQGQEDIDICEVVPRNRRSRVDDHGRYSVAHERGVHHFHGRRHGMLT